MQKTSLMLLTIAVACGWGCTNIGYKKTKTGLEYKIFSDGKGAALKVGDYVKFNYKITYKDSVIATAYGFIPGYDVVDSVGRPHDFSEFLKDMKVGDSAVCIQNFDTLSKISPYGPPPYMKKGEQQKTTIKILGTMTGMDNARADYDKEIEKFKQSEVAVIEKYLSQKNIKAEKTKNGVFVEIQSKGNGPACDSGKLVSIKYSGYNFAGKYFDSNIDSTKQSQPHPLEPFPFVAKQEGAIQGMLEAITYFNQGSKGRMFIPSILGYGPRGNPPAIAPNENLIFDIEVVEVKEVPQQQQNPMPPVPQVDSSKAASSKKKK
ncbi:MAG: FKBP-type peptidyl-prolyl cis-trans isomerase [Chitinophagaceae bacterium]|nr:FKBP-type peptidyl-prolyl cis-trans isomerase [Chitinophagaceae bacterium]